MTEGRRDDCQVGRAKKSLTPPPVAAYHVTPGSKGLGDESFQTVSSRLPLPSVPIAVPPQEVTHGSLPGYCTCTLPSPTPESDPESPAAMKKVMPRDATSWNFEEMVVRSAVVTVLPSSLCARK